MIGDETKLMELIRKKAAVFLAAEKEEKICYLLMFSIFLPYLLAGAVLASALIYILVKKDSRDKILHANGFKWLALFCIPLLLSPIFHLHALGFVASIGLLAVVLVGIWIAGVMKKHIFENCLEIAIFMSFPAAVVCYLQKIVSFFTAPGTDFRSYSVFFNPNYYGMIIEFVILICIYRLLQNPSMEKKLYYLSAMAVNFIGLYIADSFSAWAAIGVSTVAILLLYKKYRALTIFVSVGAALVALVLWFPEIMPRITFVDQTCSIRMHIWQRSFEGFLENPFFGKGTLSYFLVSQDEMKTMLIQPHAHNILLDSLLNYGLFGTAALCGFFVKQYGTRLYRLLRSASKPMALFLVAVIVSIVTHGVTDVTVLWYQTGLFVLFLLAGACVNRNEQEEEVRLPLRLSCKIKKGLDGLDGAVSVRQEVFMREQGFTGEFDDIDAQAYHIVLYDQDKPIATGRAFFNKDSESYTIGRVAVVREYRKHHIGSVVIKELERKIVELGGTKASLSAQIQAQGFYEKLGYEPQGQGYYDEHCPHIHMEKPLQ